MCVSIIAIAAARNNRSEMIHVGNLATDNDRRHDSHINSGLFGAARWHFGEFSG